MNLDLIIARFQEHLSALPYEQRDNPNYNSAKCLDVIPWYVLHALPWIHCNQTLTIFINRNWVAVALLSLLEKYPSGLTFPVMLNELQQSVR